MTTRPASHAVRRRLRGRSSGWCEFVCAGLAALLVVVVAAGPRASIARADADPASTVLVSQTLFLAPDASATPEQAAQLRGVLRAVDQAGLPIRVAVIASDYDLGSVTALWRKPRQYARFLRIELSHVYRKALLVVMPNGLGISWPGHSTAAAYRLLSRIPIRSGAAGLVTAAESAVRTLAAGNGSRLTRASRSGAGAPGRPSRDAAVAVTAAATAALLAVLAVLAARLMRRRRRRGRARPPTRDEPAIDGARALGAGRRWAVPGLAVLGCAAAGVPILVVGLLRHAPVASGSQPSGVGTPYTWRPGRRRAPGFRLTGENGRPVSLAAYQGRPVIITFVDPLCRDLCPLAAHVLDQVDRDLPRSQRAVILAVSVNVYGDSRANLREDSRRWDLVPQWHWAVGPRRRLQAVWRRYDVGVSVDTATIAGTTVHSISHDEVAFLIDRSGYVRALYGWPYYPQNVEAAVKRFGRS
jgi:cytochrome oxidase Cu insertion factor (SCO1/SenC/PrrC family)